ncbi:MAG: hypothetical protein ACLPWS_04330 [Rhodomicrobium sp.]
MQNQITGLLGKLWEISLTPAFMSGSTAVALALFYAWKRTLWRAIVFSIAFPGVVGFLSETLEMLIQHFEPRIIYILVLLLIFYISLIFPSFLCGFLVSIKCFRDALRHKSDYKPAFRLFLFICFQFLCIAGTLFMATLAQKDTID